MMTKNDRTPHPSAARRTASEWFSAAAHLGRREFAVTLTEFARRTDDGRSVDQQLRSEVTRWIDHLMGALLLDVKRGLEEGEVSRVLELLRGFYRLARWAGAIDVASEVEAIGRALRVAHGPNLRLLVDAARAWYHAHSSDVRTWLRGPFEELPAR